MSTLHPKQQLMVSKQSLDMLSIFSISLSDFFIGQALP
jgi:hypothetical protein